MNDSIYRIIKAKSKIKDLDEDIFTISSEEENKVARKEVIEVISGVTFLGPDYLDDIDLRVGDVYKKDRKCYLNIRPDCDLVSGRTNYDGELYLIQGDVLTKNQQKKYLDENYKQSIGFFEIHNEAIVLGLDNREIILFKFNKIYQKDASELISENKRICRILPPYSNRIQQRFNAYLGRIGTPRFPDFIVQDIKREFLESQEDEK